MGYSRFFHRAPRCTLIPQYPRSELQRNHRPGLFDPQFLSRFLLGASNRRIRCKLSPQSELPEARKQRDQEMANGYKWRLNLW